MQTRMKDLAVVLPAGKAPFFTDAERAAMRLAEAVTRPAGTTWGLSWPTGHGRGHEQGTRTR
ncbi:hypothetical protein [Streptomyces sp. NPDC050164]|uniref:hypothetical protein n=1 Tax=Streptomyces sp. NPDC050164 TaxID=3365605 RepID=UPI00379E4D8B